MSFQDRHEMKNISICFENLTDRLLLNLCMLIFSKLLHLLTYPETEKLCSWTYLLENNQVQQFIKFVVCDYDLSMGAWYSSKLSH